MDEFRHEACAAQYPLPDPSLAVQPHAASELPQVQCCKHMNSAYWSAAMLAEKLKMRQWWQPGSCISCSHCADTLQDRSFAKDSALDEGQQRWTLRC